jgi:hypothetical protein
MPKGVTVDQCEFGKESVSASSPVNISLGTRGGTQGQYESNLSNSKKDYNLEEFTFFLYNPVRNT